jgi:PhnB protein
MGAFSDGDPRIRILAAPARNDVRFYQRPSRCNSGAALYSTIRLGNLPARVSPDGGHDVVSGAAHPAPSQWPIAEEKMADQPVTEPVCPYLTIAGAEKAIAFYVKAFGAKETARLPADDGKRIMHAALDINGGTVMLSDHFPEFGGDGAVEPPTLQNRAPVAVVLSYPAPADVDAVFHRAVDAGATGIAEPADMFWGARFAMLADPFGHRWFLSGPQQT